MKSVKESLLDRRSIRRYEREPIPQSTMDLIYEAIRNTPTSYNGQQYSVIDVTDSELKEKIYELTNAKQIKTCNHFLVFCADFNKIKVLADAKGSVMPPITDTADGLMLGVIDATLAMMSALTVAEAEGLGACCVGYTRTAAPREVSRLLGLPEGVFVVCGLTLGIPRELPDMKPKQPLSLLIHHDTYRADDMTAELKAYDETIKVYNSERAGTKSDNDWCNHILGYYTEALKYDMLDKLKERGFDIKS